jgi:hypothetical protein
MSQTGSLRVHVFASRAQLPVADATVAVAKPQEDGRYELLAVQLTDPSGMAGPIVLPAPDFDLSQDPGLAIPFASYSVVVEHPDYHVALFQQLQIFSGVETLQNVPLLPLSTQDVSDGGGPEEVSTVTPQDL